MEVMHSTPHQGKGSGLFVFLRVTIENSLLPIVGLLPPTHTLSHVPPTQRFACRADGTESDVSRCMYQHRELACDVAYEFTCVVLVL